MTKYIVVPTQIPAYRFIEVDENNPEGCEFDSSYVETYTEALNELERNIKEIGLDVSHSRIQQILNSDDCSNAISQMDSNVLDSFIDCEE